MAAIDHLMQLRRSQDPQTPPDCVARFMCTKHSWRGKYRRVFCITPHMLVTQHPDSLAITNTWSFVGEPDIDAVSVGAGDAEDQEFTLSLRQDAKARAASAPRASTGGAACATPACLSVHATHRKQWSVVACPRKGSAPATLARARRSPEGRPCGRASTSPRASRASSGRRCCRCSTSAWRSPRRPGCAGSPPRSSGAPPAPEQAPCYTASGGPERPGGPVQQRPALTRCRSGHCLDRPPRATLAGACRLPRPRALTGGLAAGRPRRSRRTSCARASGWSAGCA